ncbi:substrate-binding domain-containing protein [Cellulophaga baltica]|uniref:ABC-type nitrate/sulfonate/bicarbonate transport system, substrate-binding protein n=1 Tax=Cellulophaga baltica TaxID=76594 RepID=A0A1G7HR62_9FLAO|nr:substrate-binding domain-containing protein [Cellulophaga baltica]SDF02774.1 ABC-type nitrate/sulfonate/bicarbonate transport system, substrate-binding protein [Cellulophaga baltica]
MKKVRIIGVPEHFNLPWHMAIEENAFKERGIDLSWTDIPEGTGKMCQMLENDETDLAIILTEGIVKSISAGNPVKIVQEFIATPLLWGIHVAAISNYKTIADLKDSTAAISRFGSGSHLMAYVNADNQGWSTKDLKFEVINNLDGAITALTANTADYFMWERFTTKPVVDRGIFRRVADCPTPWPCFVIAASDKFLKEHPSLVHHITEVINLYTEEFKNIPSIDKTLANAYGQKLEDIKEWLAITKWSQKPLKVSTLQKVQDTLFTLNLIDKKLAPEAILV